MNNIIRDVSEVITDEAVAQQRAATRKRLAVEDRRRRLRHRVTAGAVFVAVVGAVTAGAIVLTPPPPPAMSDATRMALYQTQLDRDWSVVQSVFPDLERPDVEPIQFMDSIEDQYVALSECLEAEGVPNTLNSEGTGLSWGSGVDPTLPNYICMGRYPLDPALYQPLSDEEIDYIRDFYIQVLTPCAVSYGYRVTPPPTAEEFRRVLRSDDLRNVWFPVHGLSDPQMERLASQCPTVPPLRFNAG
jgi:hypothetical protein